jgi:cobalamin biosynthesis Mg chelatase CobN
MHLLAAQAGALQQDGEAIDLGQTPAPIIFASAADSELLMLAAAADRAGSDKLRLANLLRLNHNLSVDLWCENTVQHARLVIVRLLGGAAYWQYGVDELTALALSGKIQLALLPGDATPDPILQHRSTIPPEDWTRLHSFFTAGGPENADSLLAAFHALAAPVPLPVGERVDRPKAETGEGKSLYLSPKPFPRFGFWHPSTGMAQSLPPSPHPNVPILFYRAALEGAGTATLEALIAELERNSLSPIPIVVSTLKEGACIRFVQAAFAEYSPSVILNLTGFALGLDSIDPKLNPFAGTDAPVIQLIQGGRPEAQWAADSQGLTAKDLAMQVVLPELDGRIGMLLVGHKHDAVWHQRTQCPLSAYAPDHDGIRRAVTLAQNWTTLRHTPPADRRVAIVLANYPIRDGRLANGVGYDAPQSTVEILKALEGAGYSTGPSVGSPSPLRGGDRGGGPSTDHHPIPDHRTTPTPNPSPQGGGEREIAAVFNNAGHTRSKRVTQSRRLRNEATTPERLLWPLLKTFEGVHFRRQVPIGPYIADFACHHPKLVIEVDGVTHFTESGLARDDHRDAFLVSVGYQVLHLPASDVRTNPDGIWQLINATLEDLSPTAPAVGSPSPLRGGDRGGGPSDERRTIPGHRTTPTPSPSPQGGGGREIVSNGLPPDGNALIALLQSGPTNAHPERGIGILFPIARYRDLFAQLPEKLRTEVAARWGNPEADPFCRDPHPQSGGGGPPEAVEGAQPAFHLPALRFGNLAILLQPARGYHLDESASYHDPDLVPPHGYLAAYLWLRHEFAAHAVVHNGKHGNLEWLPGKATALDITSYPAALWAELPQLYPFIVNDPGEGTQAKRRTGAVIIDHLVPPLTRAETYGPLKDLEALLDEYYAASGMDRRRLAGLRQRILDFTRDARLDRDIGLGTDDTENLRRIDTFLCDLKEAQIRDGLHIFGQSPTGRLERDLAIALARVPRGESPGGASLIRALADDLKLGIDPLTADLGAPWTGPSLSANTSVGSQSPQGGGGQKGRTLGEIAPFTDPHPQSGGGGPPEAVEGASPRTLGDVVEHLESLAASLLDGTATSSGPATTAVLETIEHVIRPRLAASGPSEIAALIAGLDGRFIAPGPSGAPSRGRLDVLPTGRNFYSVDIRAVPTPTAWELGQKSAENLLLRHFQDHGTPLRSLALSVWGTANMRTGGDDIAQALAFIGARPVWDPSSLRLSGYEIIPLARLGRPRVDVTLRISGFFRDAFPAQIDLFDKATRAIGALDEPEDQNPIAARMRTDALSLMKSGADERTAALGAGHRIFGSKPGAYGAGLQGLIDSGSWQTKGDLAEAFLNWGQYAYGAHSAGIPARDRFAARLSDIEAVVHNQDNREHDLLDSDDYYQFEGGLAATAETLTGHAPAAYHNDHSRPERPLTRTLEEELSRVMRSRVVNPKWIDGVKRHGYKGAFEIIATVDYMFAFAATTGAVKTHHFDLAFEAFVEDEATRDFIRRNNRFGYDELIAKFNEARTRGFWTPRSNSVHEWLDRPAE